MNKGSQAVSSNISGLKELVNIRRRHNNDVRYKLDDHLNNLSKNNNELVKIS
jgi:hypothetical protein